jgi:lipoprotein-anchoring transpeptidase ErfK/SrfK
MHISLTVVKQAFIRRTRAMYDPPWGMLVVAVLLAALVTPHAAAAAMADHSVRLPTGPSLAWAARPVADTSVEVTPAATQLLSQYGGNLDELRKAGQTALRAARNEGTIAHLLTLPGIARLNPELEQAGRLLPSNDPVQLADAVDRIRIDSELIHNDIMRRGPSHLIVISLHDQHLTAYDKGRILLDTPVTTGRPQLSTDIGLMHVLRTNSPWTMKSPWPKGSPLWYPDTPVSSVAWFTDTGEGIHDASWEPASAFGPGSENGPYASHGCVHMPSDAQATLFAWVTVGTPVVVIPGDGTAVLDQLATQSVDAEGNPIGGIRGA